MERLRKMRNDCFGRKKESSIYADKQHVTKTNFMFCCSFVCVFTLKRLTSLGFDASKGRRRIRAPKQHVVMTLRPFDV